MNRTWLHASMIRALKTVAQTLGGIMSAGIIFSDIDWKIAISASLFAGAYSIVMSLAGLPEVTESKV